MAVMQQKLVQTVNKNKEEEEEEGGGGALSSSTAVAELFEITLKNVGASIAADIHHSFLCKANSKAAEHTTLFNNLDRFQATL